MAKITRATQKIFGSTAGTNQIAQFGSLAASAPTFTTNPVTIQALSNYLAGWFNAVEGQNSPAIEDMNALHYLYAYQLAYVMQQGVAEWDAATTYYAGSLVNNALYTFTVTSANATINATFTNNGQTFTVLATIASSTTLLCTGTGAPSASGTLTKATGSGDATIAFASNVQSTGLYFSLVDTNLNNFVSDVTKWRPASFTNPMTTAGDMIIGGTNGFPTRVVAPGAAGYMLASTSATASAFTQTPTLVGATASQTIQNNGAVGPLSAQGYSATAATAPSLVLARSRNASLGAHTIVQSGDALGSLGFWGSNGTSFDIAALIRGEVDGTPGASSDMPGRMLFLTTPDNSGTLLEAMRVTNAQYVLVAATSPNTSGAKFQVGGSGITYPSSPTLVSDANTMEGYKEADFPPSISYSGTITGIAYDAARAGRYTRFGNTVNVSGLMLLTSRGSAGSGSMRLNLPYTIANSGSSNGNLAFGGSVNFSNLTIANGAVNVVFEGTVGNTYVNLFCYSLTTGTATVTQLGYTSSTATSLIEFTITYQTNDAF